MTTVASIIAAETATPVPPAVLAVTEQAISSFGPGSILAVLFYGSCLRDGITTGRLVDLYLLAESYEAAHRSRAKAWANRLVPPNVYYVECPHEGELVRAKVALVELRQLERLVRPETDNPYFWARFAQPTGIVLAREQAVTERIRALLLQAVQTLAAEARPLLEPKAPPETLFVRAFEATYPTELRSEPPGRAAEIVAASRPRYAALAEALLPILPPGDARRWRHRGWQGKLWSVSRLIKAAFTFQGGLDYLAWKIERHSGVKVALSPWQRRHPILGALGLYLGTRKRGGFR